MLNMFSSEITTLWQPGCIAKYGSYADSKFGTNRKRNFFWPIIRRFQGRVPSMLSMCVMHPKYLTSVLLPRC